MKRFGAIMFVALVFSAVGTARMAAADVGPASKTNKIGTPRDALAFKVLRDGSEFGSHVIRFSRDGDRLVVDVDISLRVDFAFVTLFSYEHRNRENWRDDRLVSIETWTDNDGKPFAVSGAATTGGFEVSSKTQGVFSVPLEIMPSSYWNIATVRDNNLLDTQAGRLLDIEVAELGTEIVATDDAGPVPSRRFRISGDLDLELWYGMAGDLTRLAFRAPSDDSLIEYRRVAAGAPETAPGSTAGRLDRR
jgi:hypothetical protein